MPNRVAPSVDQLRDLEILILAHHPLILIETAEEDRAEALLGYLAAKLGLPIMAWTSHRGLIPGGGGAAIGETGSIVDCLAHLERANLEAIAHLRGSTSFLGDPAVISVLPELHRKLFEHRGAVVFTGPESMLPAHLRPLFTTFDLAPPTPEAYYQFIRSVLRDLRRRTPFEIDMTGEDVATLLSNLRGLTLFEVRKVITRAIVEDGRLDRDDLAGVLDAKKRIIAESGVLEYYPADAVMDDVAGLAGLKDWLTKRKAAFRQPGHAQRFGLTAPRGLLLVGVQGCGKSLCAKAVAAEWSLPLIRFDPSSLYDKYVGETEKNLRRAIKTAEAMAPIVLWIDEIEKAFARSDGGDDGPASRLFGTFLTWLNDKKEDVFVVATANDIKRLPPELIRKGRFDEIFFVDLPNTDARRAIIEVHLARRGWAPATFQLDALEQATRGFSGAEIEQVIISALYSAFAVGEDLSTKALLREIAETRPLSVTMAEGIAELRAWAADRTVSAQ